MKKMKTVMLLMATLLILTVALCINASAAEWKSLMDKDFQFTYDKETGVMVIKGDGEFYSGLLGLSCPYHYIPSECVCTWEMDPFPFELEFERPEVYEAYCASLKAKTLILQEGITSLESSAFYLFLNVEVVILPQSVTEIPAGAFDGLNKLHTVALSNSLTSIGESAFSGCTNLKNIYMPDTLKTVGKNAFYGCDRENIRIPASATVEDGNLAPVKNLTATEKKLVVTLSWDESTNAEGYTVKCIQNGKTVTTKDTSYTIKVDTPSKYYSFKVTPYLTKNGKTVYGEEASVRVFTKPEAPKVSVKETATDRIVIKWSDNNNSVKYGIYSKTGNGSWQLCDALYDDEYGNDYEFRNLKPGKKYYFAVRSYHEDFYGIVLGDYTIITAATTPATVTAKATSPSKGKITLTWNNVDGDIDGYRVYYKVGNGNYQVYKNYSKAGTLNFSNLKSGTKYTFAVRAGIKTSGGIVWSGYKESVVTVK